MILSVVTQHAGELKKKTFKVLCQFRVLVEWKKKGGHFEPLVSSLPHKRALVLDTGPASSCGTIDLKTPRALLLLLKNDFDPPTRKK